MLKNILFVATIFSTMLPVANAADQTDWPGFSLALLSSHHSGKNIWNDGDYPLKGSTFGGARISFDKQFDQLVIGGQISTQFGNMAEKDYPDFEYKGFYDLNGRLGYAVDKVLIYATGGYSISSIKEDGVSYSRNGYNYGVGAAYGITNNVSVGIEYLQRRFSAHCEPHDELFKQRVNSVQASIAHKF